MGVRVPPGTFCYAQMISNDDQCRPLDLNYYMGEALKEACRAAEKEEIPIGCVIVHEGRIIARAHNQVEMLKDATAHAEMIALTQAESHFGDWRLKDVTVFVTKEPCPMCAGAMIQTRVKKVVFGVWADRDGAAGTVLDLLNHPGLGSSIEYQGGVREEECRELLRVFFNKLRSAGS